MCVICGATTFDSAVHLFIAMLPWPQTRSMLDRLDLELLWIGSEHLFPALPLSTWSCSLLPSVKFITQVMRRGGWEPIAVLIALSKCERTQPLHIRLRWSGSLYC